MYLVPAAPVLRLFSPWSLLCVGNLCCGSRNRHDPLIVARECCGVLCRPAAAAAAMEGHALSLTLLLLLASPPSAHFLEFKKSKYFILASFNSSWFFPLVFLLLLWELWTSFTESDFLLGCFSKVVNVSANCCYILSFINYISLESEGNQWELKINLLIICV